ncbi:uncharacterized protein PHACADRAFT_180259 [Phanerochaete carnosa HHB-10118-sp]|uniref:BRCT domain-containing protein n=1 Tax=Phanerochaete carnosa (strain HHB-10118-sp) TaxID=650164 RepID=K5VDP9_PHACS|nr:uncharacterized protein PHACADRAFT_180259 [Phanerochaete carnosa HHB-10118-sp]EKM61111.1 hypothetical protein PHACADRAFT_180259 [Phanerochaete carnosa HHB-10118-sp]
MSDDDPIFVAGDGSPLKIFVEPTDVPDRAARLIKKLKKSGADIRISPRDADIIVVGEDVDIRRKVVNSSKDKIILDYKWVQASLKRDAAYLDRENWGRYRVFPEDREDECVLVHAVHGVSQELTLKSALPTPRPTPVNDSASAQNTVSNSLAAHVQLLPSHIPTAPAQFSYPLPNSQLNPQLTTLLQQLVAANSSVLPQQSAPHTQHWAADPATLLSGPTMLIPVQLQQRILDHMLSLSPNSSLSWQLAQLVEQFTKQQASGHGIVPGLSTLPQINHAPLSSPTQPHMPPPLSGYNHMSAPPFTFQQGSSSNLPSFGQAGSTSASHPSESISATVPVKRERLGRDDASSRQKKHRKPSAEDSDDERQARATPERSAKETPGLFVDRKGRPIPIYVQHAKWRNKYVPDIQKFGGKIVANIADADYAVLFTQALGSWDYLRTAVEAGTPAVKALYITDCLAKGKLLNSSAYSFEGSQLKDEHGNMYVAKLAELRAQSREEKQKKAPRNHQSSSEEEEEEEEEEVSEDGKAVKRKKLAGNRFTEEELTRAREYIKQLFEKEPNASSAAVCQALCQKIPTHSAASWSFKLGGFEGSIELARKQMKARAKAEQKPAKEDSALADPAPASPPAQPIAEPQPSAPEQPQEGPFHEDLAAIVDQFVQVVNGQYNNETDEEVFAILSDRAACRTAASWQEFYTKYQDVIENLVQEFTSSTQQPA